MQCFWYNICSWGVCNSMTSTVPSQNRISKLALNNHSNKRKPSQKRQTHLTTLTKICWVGWANFFGVVLVQTWVLKCLCERMQICYTLFCKSKYLVFWDRGTLEAHQRHTRGDSPCTWPLWRSNECFCKRILILQRHTLLCKILKLEF